MPSLIFNSALEDMATDAIDFAVDDFHCILVTDAYVPDKDADMRRSDVTNEVVGAGYTAGGEDATVGVTKDTVNDRLDISLGAISVPAATITARGAVYCKWRGGLASADELVAYIDFGDNVTSTNATWSLSASTIRLQN